MKEGVQTCLNLDSDIKDWIREFAAEQGISMTEAVEDLIRRIRDGGVKYTAEMTVWKKKYENAARKIEKLRKQMNEKKAEAKPAPATQYVGGRKWQKFMDALNMEQHLGEVWQDILLLEGVADPKEKIFWEVWQMEEKRPPDFLYSVYAPDFVLAKDEKKTGPFSQAFVLMRKEDYQRKVEQREAERRRRIAEIMRGKI